MSLRTDDESSEGEDSTGDASEGEGSAASGTEPTLRDITVTVQMRWSVNK